MAETKARPAVNDWLPPSMANPGGSVTDESTAQNGATPHLNGSQPESISLNGATKTVEAPAVNGSKATVEELPVSTVNGHAPASPEVIAVPPNGAATAVAAPPAPVVKPVPVKAPAPVEAKPAEAKPAKAAAPAETKPAEPAPKKRRLPMPLIVLVVFVGAYFVWHYVTNPPGDANHLSGTIEANEIRLASQIGGRVRKVYVNEGDHVTTNMNLIDVYSATGVNESITAPIDGVVMERLIEPGEIALPNSTIMVVADLDALSLTVYVPEDQYGRIQLGQSYNVTVDSFPGQSFGGRVSHIADTAEYTPKNVQTTEGRKSTVFGVKLDLDPSGGKLKPGMPADVYLEAR